MCLQLLTGWAVVSFLTAAARESRESALWWFVDTQQWDLSWTFALFRMAGLNQRWVIPDNSYSEPVVLVLDLLQTVAVVFLPVFAAYSVAPDRGHQRLQPWLATGLNPLQLLAAQGLGALALVLAVSYGLQLTWMSLWLTETPPEPLGGFLWACGWGAGSFLIRAGLLVCVSALCASARTALLWCCGLTFLGFPLLTALISVPRWWVGTREFWEMVNSFGPLIIEAMLLTVLLPRAVAYVERSAPFASPAASVSTGSTDTS
jgi:hypothetical protein